MKYVAVMETLSNVNTEVLTSVLVFFLGGPTVEGLSAGGERGMMSGMSILWSVRNCITVDNVHKQIENTK